MEMGVKAMPGSIPTPDSELLLKNKRNTGSQMGHTKKIFKKEKTRNPIQSNSFKKDGSGQAKGTGACYNHVGLSSMNYEIIKECFSGT